MFAKPHHQPCRFALVAAALLVFLVGGCSPVGRSSDSAVSGGRTGLKNEPYYPTNFNDLEVPGELEVNRETTMYITTESFTGGVINFTGNVEVSSLTDFFVNAMQKNGWKLNGDVRYKNILLSFAKPNKNCMISITEADITKKTKVSVYITDNLAERRAGGAANNAPTIIETLH